MNEEKKLLKEKKIKAIPFDSNRKCCRIFEEWPQSIVELRNERCFGVWMNAFLRVWNSAWAYFNFAYAFFFQWFFSSIHHAPLCVCFSVVYVLRVIFDYLKLMRFLNFLFFFLIIIRLMNKKCKFQSKFVVNLAAKFHMNYEFLQTVTNLKNQKCEWKEHLHAKFEVHSIFPPKLINRWTISLEN